MASTKKSSSADRQVKNASKVDQRAANKEKVHRESSRSRTSMPDRELINKGRNDKLENEPKNKHRSSSREASRHVVASTSKDKSKEFDVRQTHSRTNREIIETKLGKDHNANAKATIRKTPSKKIEDVITKSEKESHSKSRSTHGETGNYKHKTSSKSSREVPMIKPSKSRVKDNVEIGRNSQTKASSYAIIDNKVQSDVEEDYSDDFENYESDFESSSSQEEKIEEKVMTPKDTNSLEMPQLSQPLKTSAPKLIDIKIPENVKETGIPSYTSHKVNRETVQQNIIQEQPKDNTHKNNPLTKEDDKMTSSMIKSQSFINFSTAKQQLNTKKTSNKLKKRGDVLLDLITLDETSINLFSMAPTTYDEFMITFGSTNTRQAYIQTGDDNVPESSQTDPVEMLDLWIQCPPFIGGAAGGEFIAKRNKQVEVTSIKNWKRLNQFLHMASRTMCNILEDDQIALNDNTNKGTKGNYEFSDRVSHMKQSLVMQEGSKITLITCSKLQPHILLAICEGKIAEIDTQSHNSYVIIGVWNVYQPSVPQKLLICKYANPLSCCLDDQANFAFVGMDDCTIAMWDLRESDGFHNRKTYDDKQSISFRYPTYSTAGMWAPEGHHGAVVAILCRQDNYSSTNALNHTSLAGDQNPCGIIHLASLEEPANIFIWVVSELSQPPVEYEPGLSPHGRVKLIKSSVINLQELPNAQQYLKTYPRVFDFINDPIDSSIFYVATDMGVIISCSHYGGKCKVYGQALDIGAEATSLCYLPMGRPSCFLAGYNDGSVILYGSKKEKALMIWRAPDNTTGVVKVQWSSSSPNIFYVLHKDGRMYIWDLNKNDLKPATIIECNQKRITSFDVGNDKRFQNSSTANYKPHIIIGYDDCTAEAHYLSSRYSRNGPEEMQLFEKYVEFI